MKTVSVKSKSDSPNAEKQLGWLKLLQEESEPVFFSAWMNLFYEGMNGLKEAVLVMGTANVGPFEPKVTWPHRTPCSDALMDVSERSLEMCQPISQYVDDRLIMAVPITQGNNVYGVLAFSPSTTVLSPAQKNWVYWGIGWLLAHPSLQNHPQDTELNERLLLLLELLMSSLGGQTSNDAIQSVLSQSSVSLDCDRVSIGFVENNVIRLKGISNSAEFSKKIDLVQRIEAAMNEAADQGQLIHYPAPDDQLGRVEAHQKLCELEHNQYLVTVPFVMDDDHYGALTFEWQKIPDIEMLSLAEGIASVMGRVLLEKQLSDISVLGYVNRLIRRATKRVLGPRYLGTKLLVLCTLAFILFCYVATGPFRISSEARLEGAVNRSLSAPFDAYVASAYYRAGQVVQEGSVLARLDERDLLLEKSRWQSQLAQYQRQMQMSQAMRDSAQARIVAAQVEQAQAQLSLVESLLQRMEITAPFDALITQGDLSQDLGLPINKGQVLFVLAPLEDYRLVLDIDEGDMSFITTGQTGSLVLKAFPEHQIDFKISMITPVSQARDGKNLFRVEAQLSSLPALMQPGMEGLAKIDVSEQRLIWIWTRRLQDWLRLNIWKWLG